MPKGFYKDPELKSHPDKMQSALKDVDLRVARQPIRRKRDHMQYVQRKYPNDPIQSQAEM